MTYSLPTADAVLQQARIDAGKVEQFRENERYSSRPGDRERQERIDRFLVEMLGFMAPLRSLMARAMWDDDLVTPQQRDELDAISHRMKLARKQLKKMR